MELASISMDKYLHIVITLVGAALMAWALIQTHEVRIDKLETGFEKHLETHDKLNNQIQTTLTKIQLDVQAINTKLELQRKP
jgi:hypothetical protein